jgi:hypothetical protein
VWATVSIEQLYSPMQSANRDVKKCQPLLQPINYNGACIINSAWQRSAESVGTIDLFWMLNYSLNEAQLNNVQYNWDVVSYLISCSFDLFGRTR